MSQNNNQAAKVYLEGLLLKESADFQERTHKLADSLRTQILEAGDPGLMALALVNVDLASKLDF